MGDLDIGATFEGGIDGEAVMAIAKRKAAPAMKEAAERILDAAKDNAPVDTGALRDSGHIKEENEEYLIIFDAQVLNGDGSYARYVEEGTSKMDAQPYLRPAIMAAKK